MCSSQQHLELRVVDANTAATKLEAIQDKIVCRGCWQKRAQNRWLQGLANNAGKSGM
jgi:hypothetical protein